MIDKKREKPKHLGRGLQSLLGPITEASATSEMDKAITPNIANYPIDKELQSSLRQIKIDSVLPNPYQPRTVWNEQDLLDLSYSIKANGVVQPVIVRPSGGGYELIAGERRLKAANLAGLEDIPAIIRKATDAELLELALIENIHRKDLNPLERAQAYKKYLNTFSLTQADAAERLGEDRSVIANYIRLLDLPEEIKSMIAKNELSMGHARAILALPTDELRKKLANRALAGRLSVREVERLVRKYMTGSEQSKQEIKHKLPHIVELETRLSGQLGTRVGIETKKGGQRGKIVIEFNSLDEFDRITEMIGLESIEQV
ncbi:MAG: ParB/RepB/Spo0J family partition protein [Phycisphaerae bacterium]